MRLLRVAGRRAGTTRLHLTDFTDMKGWGCKIPKDELLGYLSHFPQTKTAVFSTSPDCYVSRSPDGRYFASSIDFFYPLVDDPFQMGQITACNVLSDLYAAGVTNVDSFLVILGLSTKLQPEDRKWVAVQLMAGLESKVSEAGSRIVGGQTVHNPWVTVGGSVMGFFDRPEHIVPNNTAKPGDVILLTKPIGTQLLVNFAQYFRKDADRRTKLETAGLSAEGLQEISERVIASMSHLNLYAARVMNDMPGDIRACTDVTGFGLRGHSDNLVEIQTDPVDFVFDEVPLFAGLPRFDKLVRNFRLKEGLAAETSGGLLVVISPERADEFQARLLATGQGSWRVGRVVAGARRTVLGEATTVFTEV